VAPPLGTLTRVEPSACPNVQFPATSTLPRATHTFVADPVLLGGFTITAMLAWEAGGTAIRDTGAGLPVVHLPKKHQKGAKLSDVILHPLLTSEGWQRPQHNPYASNSRPVEVLGVFGLGKGSNKCLLPWAPSALENLEAAPTKMGCFELTDVADEAEPVHEPLF
jgi:hypothetical protein